MSKASEYAKAMDHKRPALKMGQWIQDPEASVTTNGDCQITYRSPGNMAVDTSVVIEAAHVPALIKWLQETFID